MVTFFPAALAYPQQFSHAAFPRACACATPARLARPWHASPHPDLSLLWCPTGKGPHGQHRSRAPLIAFCCCPFGCFCSFAAGVKDKSVWAVCGCGAGNGRGTESAAGAGGTRLAWRSSWHPEHSIPLTLCRQSRVRMRARAVWPSAGQLCAPQQLIVTAAACAAL